MSKIRGLLLGGSLLLTAVNCTPKKSSVEFREPVFNPKSPVYLVVPFESERVVVAHEAFSSYWEPDHVTVLGFADDNFYVPSASQMPIFLEGSEFSILPQDVYEKVASVVHSYCLSSDLGVRAIEFNQDRLSFVANGSRFRR